MKYLKTHQSFDEHFEKLQNEYLREFNKKLEDVQTLRRIIFLKFEGMSEYEIEQTETEHDWLIEQGIGCSVEWCKGGDLFNFNAYSDWIDMERLHELCTRILKYGAPYKCDIDYTAYQYPNTYFVNLHGC